MEAVSVYIPIDRRLALARGEMVPERAVGAVLFADISGFTPLTSALGEELGPQRGAEEVLRQINPVYEALIVRLHRYGGSVIGFAGDSITCWLDQDDGSRAVACALEMQAAMAHFSTITTPSGQSLPLAIKVAVTVGPVRRFAVGDPQIQIMDVLAGRTVDKVATAESLAEKGEVVVSERVVAQVGDALPVVEWRSPPGTSDRFAVVRRLNRTVEQQPFPAADEEILRAGQARSWVLPPVYARLQRGSGFLGELRPAVSLFLKFGGLDYDHDPLAGQKLDVFIRWVQSTLERYEGYLIQLTMGDKGCYLYASFGSLLAHEDDPERAVGAALDLVSPPTELAYIEGLQIGISQGPIWTGACGSTTRRTFGAMGNEVNMSARLMTLAAPDQVLVTKRVADAVSRSYQLLSLGEMQIKGKERPIPVFTVTARRRSRRPLALFGAELVGRAELLAQMMEVAGQAAQRHGQTLCLEGPAGIGKSHLTAVFVENLTNQGWQVVSGVCQSISQSATYYPWQQVLRTVLRLDEESGDDNPAAQVARVETFIRQSHPEWEVRLPVLGAVLDLPIPDNSTTAALDPQLRQRALFALVVEMMQQWAEGEGRPSLMVLEDVHWMDQASWELTLALARALDRSPLLLLLVHRPIRETENSSEGEGSYLQALSQLAAARHLEVGEMAPEELGQLAEQRLQGKLSPVALSLIQAKAQGNPFFVHELVDALRESDMLFQGADGEWVLSAEVISALRSARALLQNRDRWVLADHASLASVDVGLPDSIQGLVLSRIDRMPEAHKLTIKVASVIGQTFEMDLLARSHPTPPEEEILQEQVREMETRDFIHLVWQVASTMDEAAPGSSSDSHLLQAGSRTTVADLEAAASQLADLVQPGAGEERTYMFKHNTVQEVAYNTLLFAQRRQLHQAVATILEQLSPDATVRLAYHFYLGAAWERALHYQARAGREAQQIFANQQAIERFQRALQSAKQLPAAKTLAERQRIHAALGELLTSTGRYEMAEEHLQQALDLAVELGASEAQANACRWLARGHELRGEYEPALAWIQKGIVALDAAETAETAELMLVAGLINLRQGETESALELCHLAMKIAGQVGELPVLARAHNLLGDITRQGGNRSEAIQHFQRALSLYQEGQNVHGQALSQNLIANAYFDVGQWRQADEYYRRARAIFHQIGDVYDRLFVDNNLGGIALNQGRLDEALMFYQEALRALEEIGGSLFVLGVLHMNLGHVFVRRGEADEALHHLNISLDYYERAQARNFLPEAYRYFAEVALLNGDVAGARAHAVHSLQQARKLAMTGEEGHSLRLLGVIALRQQEMADAEAYLTESLDLLTKVEDEYGKARSELALAYLFERQGQPARVQQLLAACILTFERLEASLEMDQVAALQKRIEVTT